jgi:hypothetical protein
LRHSTDIVFGKKQFITGSENFNPVGQPKLFEKQFGCNIKKDVARAARISEECEVQKYNFKMKQKVDNTNSFPAAV